MSRQQDPTFQEREFSVDATPDGSTYVRPQDMEWRPSQLEGISIKVLYEDPEREHLNNSGPWNSQSRQVKTRFPLASQIQRLTVAESGGASLHRRNV